MCRSAFAPIIFLFLAVLGCSLFSKKESPPISQSPAPASSPASTENDRPQPVNKKEPAGENIYSADFKAADAEIQARALVAFDRGQNTLAPADDPDVKKAKTLIEDLSKLAKESPLAIRKGVQRARKMVAEKSKVKLRNLELLEEAAEAYSKGAFGRGQGSFETKVYVWATLRYGAS